MKFVKIIVPALAVLFFVANCNNGGQQNLAQNIVKTAFNSLKFDLSKPFEKLDLSAQVFEADPAKESSYTFADGASLKVPASIFSRLDGTEPKGKVKISYKSVKSPAEIITSGLHLLYKQGDSIVPFITGGMFELTANTANGEKLKIKDGKGLTLNFPAIDKGQYNLYRMNETTKQWELVGDANTIAETMQEKKYDETMTKGNSLLKPEPFNEDKDIVIGLPVDYSQMQELASYPKIIWKYSGKKSKTELGGVLGKRWKKYELRRNEKKIGKYLIALKSDKEADTVDVAPVFSKASYQKAMAAYEQNTKTQQESYTTADRNNSQSSRQLSFISLGTYNLDICGTPNVVAVNASVEFDDATFNNESQNYHYFIVSNDGQSITRYDLKQSKLMIYYRNTKNKLIGLLPGNRVGVYSSGDFDKLNAKNSDNVKFKLKVLPDVIEKTEQLDAIIAKL
jgi:hypothetical protein